MRILLDDPKLFGNDAGEDEDESARLVFCRPHRIRALSGCSG